MKAAVVVGASLAGLRAAEALRAGGFDGTLTIVGEEAAMPYNRPPLSKGILLGSQAAEDLAIPPAEALGAEWLLGSPAIRLDRRESHVETGDGRRIPFDRLVIATGLRPRRPPLAGLDLPGVHTLRTLPDALALKADLDRGGRLVVVGGGLIGCEVAASARRRNLAVTLVGAGPTLMARSLPDEVCRVFEGHHRDQGVTVLVGRVAVRIEGDDRVTGVTLDDGSTVEAECVVVAVGSEPNVEWLAGSGLVLDGGVVCDAHGLAIGGEDRIAAAGDVAVWPHPGYGGGPMRVEHWGNAVESGEAAARALLHGWAEPYAPLPTFWSDQYDRKLQVLGLPRLARRLDIVAGNLAEMKFVAEAWRDDRLVGVVAVNMPARLAGYRARLTRDLAAAATAATMAASA